MTAAASSTPVAIVGMSVLFPGAGDVDTYWRNISGGVDAIGELPAARWNTGLDGEITTRRGGFVDEHAHVDAARFGIMPSSVDGAEPDQLLALRVAAEAVDDLETAGAGLGDRAKVGVILGRGGYLTAGIARLDQRVRVAHQLARTLGELLPSLGGDELARVREAFTDTLGPDRAEAAIGLVPNLAASRVANRLDLHGPAYTVDAACASSLVAVDQAVGELASGRCDTVLAGGVHHCHDITFWSVFSRLGALSTSERIRPFHRDADGILIGEGTGVVVLKRLTDAQRHGNRIYAVIRGSGVASDGRGASLVNPDPEGQILAVRRAWEVAGLDPAAPGSVGLIEAHGTATPAGDGAELTTLSRVFGGLDADRDGERAVVGSVKSMIGHAMPAAGIAALVKAALSVYHGVLPPTLHCDEPHPGLADTRFTTLDAARPWERDLRRAGVNAFGFGGINAHLVVENAPSGTPAAPAPVVTAVSEPERILRMSADSPGALAAALDVDDTALLASETMGEVASGRCRIGIVAPTAKRLATARKVVAKGTPWQGRSDIWFSPGGLLSGPDAKLAFLFPGLEADFSPRVDDVARHFGLPAPELSADGVGRHGAAVLRVGRLLDAALRRLGIVPDVVAGHSVGEWTALVASGVHDESQVDTLMARFDPDSLVVPGVEFAVIGCDLDRVRAAIAADPGYADLVISHENSANQTIVCGPEDRIAALVTQFRARTVICQVLPFRSGFHTPMFEPYADPFREASAALTVHEPAVPVWSATTAAEFPREPEAVRELYVRHLLEPVRFRPLVENLHAAGVRAFVQVGAGQLGSLVDDTLRDAEHLTVAANAAKRDGLAQLRRLATALWVEGAAPDFAALDSPGRQATPRRPVRSTPLDLSAGLVSLGDTATRLVTAQPAARRGTDPAPEHPLAAEFDALMRETEHSAAAIMDALAAPRGTAAPAAAAPAPYREVLRFSTETMPYLLDHCFAPQRADWPDEADRRPIVPATTTIRHMLDAAEKAAPGLRAVGLDDVRFHRWLVAAPAVDVPLTATPSGTDRMEVALGDYASATVLLAERHDATVAPPWPSLTERAPAMDARRFYDERWMFHGPRFQGITELTAIGDDHVRGVLTAPTAPGSLLDNVGQLFGYWIVETQTMRRIVFPVEIAHIRFHGEEPGPGTALDCDLRVRSTTDAAYTFDARLSSGGVVWAELTGWRDHRFDSHPETYDAYRIPERNTLSRRQDEGWYLLAERWSDLASRELYLNKYLNSAERAEYDALPPPARRPWLLRRIAAKDAVRGRMWDDGAGDIFPAELLVEDAGGATVTVRGRHGFVVPELAVAVAQCRELAVASAGEPRTRPWLRIDERTEQTTVDDAGDDVASRVVANPADLPAREYVVSWKEQQ